MEPILRNCFIVLLAISILQCGRTALPPENSDPPEDIIVAPGDDGDQIYITDRTGFRWNITDAVEVYNFLPENFAYGIGPFAIKPFTNPQFLLPGEAGYPQDNATDLLLGLDVANESRAYPLSVLRYPEVVNDRIDNRPIASCFCFLANLAAVYSRRIDGHTLTLSASGWVYNETFILYDYETNSLWYPLQGQAGLTCINGQYLGKTLPEIASQRMRWFDWLDNYPESKYLRKNDGN